MATPQATPKPPPKKPTRPPAGRGRGQGAGGRGAAPEPKQQQQQRAADAAADAVASLSVADAPTPAPTPAPRLPYTPSASLTAAVAAETQARGGRSPLSLVLLGHVDAGKSTLAGRLLTDAGAVSARDAAKLRAAAAAAGRASFGWAWLLDTAPDERARGVTVSVGSAGFSTPHHDVLLLDAPGHRDFVPAAAAGSAASDAALLVLDGSVGGFEAGFGGKTGSSAGPPRAGQTAEHAALARALGVSSLLVAITKLDTLDYEAARFEHVRAELGPFLAGLGFSQPVFIPVAAPAGQNVASRPDAPALAAWWRGPTILEAIDRLPAPPRALTAPPRLAVADVAKGPRGGARVTGRVVAGAFAPGDTVAIVPPGDVGTVLAVTVGGGGGDGGGGGGTEAGATAAALDGDVAVVAVSGIDPSTIPRGAILCPPTHRPRLATRIRARITVPAGAAALLPGAAITLHAHADAEAATVVSLLRLIDGASGAVIRPRPRVVPRGATADVEVALARPVALETFADCPPLGRVALREAGATVAVGVVMEVVAGD